jgi:FkbM family methyltransferase
MHRLLFVIPHYYRQDVSSALGSEREAAHVRGNALAHTITCLYETFGPSALVRPEVCAPASMRNTVDVIVVTTGQHHAMDHIGPVALLAHHERTEVEPLALPFAAHRVLAAAVGRYDGFGYLEDDIVVHDPFLFEKQQWFSSCVGDDALLMPARYEASGGAKAYPDADLPPVALAGLTLPQGPPTVAATWMDLELTFTRPSNPHSGTFFVSAQQMTRLARHPLFGVPNAAFVGPLETAATAAVTESFRVYKTATPNTDFLEVEHQGSHYLSAWGVPPDNLVLETARRDADARAHETEAQLATARRDADARAHESEAQLLAARHEIEDLRSSNSWRITAPVRWLSDAIKSGLKHAVPAPYGDLTGRPNGASDGDIEEPAIGTLGAALRGITAIRSAPKDMRAALAMFYGRFLIAKSVRRLRGSNEHLVSASLCGYRLYGHELALLFLVEEIFLENSYDVGPLSASPVIIDCGANIGLASLYFAIRYPGARITAYEPEPAAFALLEKNTAKLAGVVCKNVALGKADGLIEFYVVASIPGELRVSGLRERLPSGESIAVECVRLSSVLPPHVDLLKMDVEGMEWDVLDDLEAANALGSIDHLVIEYHHHLPLDRDDLGTFLQRLERLGFGYQVSARPSQGLLEARYQDVMVHAYRKEALEEALPLQKADT